MNPRFLTLPLLLSLTGCAHHQTYAEKLQLITLPPVAVLAPVPNPIPALSMGKEPLSVTIFEGFADKIRTCSSKSEADVIVAQYQQAKSIFPLTSPRPGHEKENDQMKLGYEYLSQAAQVKSAELVDGDKQDSAEEVEPRLQSAMQAAANMDELAKTAPK